MIHPADPGGRSAPGGRSISPQLCTIGNNGTGYPILGVDEAGHKREVWIDGLGNTIEVDEPDASSGSLSHATCYSYDALGNLLSVTQGSQSRTYIYDYLSRVVSATTPETKSIAVTYSYMNGPAVCSPNPSSVCSKTDGMGVTTTYTYDVLGRLTKKTYTDGTPTVNYYYDGGSGQKGYLTGMADGLGTTTWTYDHNGRITLESRTIAGQTKTVSYAWNEDGTPQQVTYPSGRNVVYETNNAEHATAAWDAAAPTVYYAYESIYSVAGALRGTYNGHIASAWNGIYFTESFNNRLQVNGFSAASTAGIAESLTINYNAVGNNGNIASITNGVTAGLSENYGYDMLDRILTGATQSSTATGCWGQSFGASGAADDIYGNLTQMSVTQCTASSLSVTVNASYNQLNTSPMLYTNAGNMTSDGSSNAYIYDAENHLTTALVTSGSWGYIYDGNGLRVAKCDNATTYPCGGASGGTLYWRDILGNVLSESDLSGNITNDYIYFGGRKVAQEGPTGTTHYFFPDQTGTTVAMTDSSGNVCYDATFTPYGEEHSTLDTCSSTGTSTNYKFTGYERDSETGLDYAFARYYSSRLGRFMSADPLAGSITNPQGLNRYAYVANNPIRLVDPSGMNFCIGAPNSPVPPPLWCNPHEPGFDDPEGLWVAGAWQAYDAVTNAINAAALAPAESGLDSFGQLEGIEPGPVDATWDGVAGVVMFSQFGTDPTYGNSPNGEVISATENGNFGFYSTSLPSTLPPIFNAPILSVGLQNGQSGQVPTMHAAPPASPPTHKVTPGCLTAALVQNFLGDDAHAGASVLFNGIAWVIVTRGAPALLPGPGWLYVAMAVLYDASQIATSYADCKNNGSPSVQ
jgi:RHS repeat-associated protein